jgi:3-methylcrotonyl-CoA carboxylase alpha subunit
MNARLQVEHPATELVYGIDLVQWQLRIAAGEPLAIAQADVRPRGWAIEARIYAEDPANGMLPSTGVIARWSPPQGPGIRVDAGVTSGSEVSHYYDPMLAKLIVFGSDRDAAIRRLERSLLDFSVDGVRTNLPLLHWIARDDAFVAGDTTTSFLAQRLDESIFKSPTLPREAVLLCAAALLADGRAPWRIGGVGVPLHLQYEGHLFDITADVVAPGVWQLSDGFAGELRAARRGDTVHAEFGGASLLGSVTYSADAFVVHFNDRSWNLTFAAPPSFESAGGHRGAVHGARVTAPMPGKIVKVAVREGEAVEDHALLVVLEAMKMEHRIEATAGATVKSVLVKEGQIVTSGTPLVELS